MDCILYSAYLLPNAGFIWKFLMCGQLSFCPHCNSWVTVVQHLHLIILSGLLFAFSASLNTIQQPFHSHQNIFPLKLLEYLLLSKEKPWGNLIPAISVAKPPSPSATVGGNSLKVPRLSGSSKLLLPDRSRKLSFSSLEMLSDGILENWLWERTSLQSALSRPEKARLGMEARLLWLISRLQDPKEES